MKGYVIQGNVLLIVTWAVSFSILGLVSTVQGAPNYRVDLESFKAHKHEDYTYLKIHQARLTKYNRTTAVFNASGEVLEDVPLEATAKIVCFEKQKSGKFSLIPVQVLPPSSVCDMIEKPNMYYPVLKKSCPNCPDKCPIKKGEYMILNMLIDGNTLPDRLPGDRWSCDLSLMDATKERAKFTAVAFINRQI